MPLGLEAIAYSIARGWTRGVTDAMLEAIENSHTAVEEATTDEDRARAIRMRDAVQRLHQTSNPGSINSSSSKPSG